MSFRFLTPAITELEEAAEFYESRDRGLGLEFLSEVEDTLFRIGEHPDAWGKISTDIRKCPTRRFPYFLVYTIVEAGEILIISVFHQRRKPSSWRSNLE